MCGRNKLYIHLPAPPAAQCVTQTSGCSWTTWKWPKRLSPARLTSPLCSTLRSMSTKSKLTWRKVAGMHEFLIFFIKMSGSSCCLSFWSMYLSLICRTKSRATRKINFEENSQNFTISSLTESMEDTSISLQVSTSCQICVVYHLIISSWYFMISQIVSQNKLFLRYLIMQSNTKSL